MTMLFINKESKLHFWIKFFCNWQNLNIFQNRLKQILEADPSKGFLFGDSGYALSPVVITPIHRPATPEEIQFNNRHSRIRSQVERSIGN